MRKYARYKNSGISWIGDVPEHWETKRLKYVVDEFCKGNGITKEEVFPDGDIKCVRYGEIYSKYDVSFSDCYSLTKNKFIASPQYFSYGDILFAGTGELVEEIGKNIVYLGNEKCLAGGDIIVAKHSQNPSFLNYALESKYCRIQKSYGKAKLKVVHISAGEIGNIVILLPPLSEQKAIAEYLDKKTAQINELVSAKQKQIELLKEYKQSVIANAVTGKLDERREKRKWKDSGISWIGKIPENWEIKRIRHVFNESDEKITDNTGELLSLSQYTGVSLKRDCEKVGMFEAETTEGYKIVHRNQFVMNIMLAWNGSYAVSELEGVISPAYCVFDFIIDCIPKYFHYLLRLKAYAGAFKTLSKGIIDSRLRLYPSKFYTFPVIIPPLSEQKEIVAYIEKKVSSIDSQITSIENQIANLNEYKQSLISDVVTGKVKVC